MRAGVLTAFFKEIDKGDVEVVGGKGANLGEMTRAGIPAAIDISGIFLVTMAPVPIMAPFPIINVGS